MKAALVLVVVLAAIVGCRHRDARPAPGAPPAAATAREDDDRGDAGIRLPPGHPALAPSMTKQPGDVQL